MSSRVTRSATKLAAESSSAAATPADIPAAAQALAKSHKRKALIEREPSPGPDTKIDTKNPTPPRRAKKQKIVAEASSSPATLKPRRLGGQQSAVMAKPGWVSH